jgi:uncharacterized protein
MVHVFQEKNDWYVYDMNSNEVFGVEEIVAKALMSTAKDREGVSAELSKEYSTAEIDAALAEIDDTREKHGIFKEWELGWGGKCPICSDPANYEKKIQQLVIETTSDCNLRCVYCNFTYQAGEHARQSNSLEVLTDSVNYFLDHSGEGEHRVISFYGGEPLLAIDNIRLVLGILEKRGLKDSVELVLDTNATLVDDEIVELIASNDIRLQISLDGPEHVHDANRVFANGKGSHATVMQNIKRLSKKLPDYVNKALYMATLAPPYEIEEIDSYFQNLHSDLGIEGEAHVMANFASINHVLDHYTELHGDCRELQLAAYSRAVEHYVSYSVAGRHDELGPVYKALFDRNLANLYRRSNLPIPEKMGLNACCAPGVRKLYVNTRGEYLPCERMSYDYVIGSADEGISHDLVDSLYKDLGETVKDRCLSCWAVRLCSLCFTHMLEKRDGSGLHVPQAICDYMRNSKEEDLKLFLGLHQANPESLDFLKSMKFE